MKQFRILFLMLALTAPLFPQSADVLLRAAMDKELVDADLKGAIAAYQRILDSRTAARDIKAKALLHQADCQQKLGTAEARGLYERLLKEYPDQAQVVAEARVRISSLGSGGQEVRERFLFGGVWNAELSSRDGRYISYVPKSSEDRMYYDTLTGKHGLLKKAGPLSYGPIISPDGSKIAFAQVAEPRDFRGFQIHVADFGGGNDVIVTPDTRWFQARIMDWHPTRQELSILHWDNDRAPYSISVVDVARKTHKLVYRQPDGEEWLWGAKYTPDGNHIVFLRKPDRNDPRWYMEIIPATGGTPTRLPVPPANKGDLLGITRDSQLVYVSDIRGQQDLWSLPLQAGKAVGEPQLIKHYSSNANYRVADDGRILYTIPIQVWQFFTAQIDSSSGKRISDPVLEKTPFVGAARGPSYSPDGNFLAYVSGKQQNWQIRIRNLSSGQETAHTPPLFDVIKIRWFPDGKALLLYANDYGRNPGFFRYDLASKNFSAVFQFDSGDRQLLSDSASTAVVTPDGQSIVFKYRTPDRAYVGVRAIGGGPIRTIDPFPPPAHMRMFALSPEGKTIALGFRDSKNRDHIGVIPFEGGELRVIYSYPETKEAGYQRAWGALAFTADGQHVLFQRPHNVHGDEVWRVPVTGGPAQALFTTGMIMEFAVHPDNKRITVWANSNHQDVYVMENAVKVRR